MSVGEAGVPKGHTISLDGIVYVASDLTPGNGTLTGNGDSNKQIRDSKFNMYKSAQPKTDIASARSFQNWMLSPTVGKPASDIKMETQEVALSAPVAVNMCRNAGRFLNGRLGECMPDDMVYSAMALDMNKRSNNLCVLHGFIKKTNLAHGEYGRINVLRTPDGGFRCLPWATLVFSVATSSESRPQRVELRPDGALVWINEFVTKLPPSKDVRVYEAPSFISVSGLTYSPRAVWTYGTTQMDCLPVTKQSDSSIKTVRQSHVKSCISTISISVDLQEKKLSNAEKVSVRCKLYKRLICSKDKTNGKPRTTCLQQKEGSCVEATIVDHPSIVLPCHVDFCANILATL
jgi:hypothetical protein